MNSFKVQRFSNKFLCKDAVVISLNKLNYSSLMLRLGVRIKFLSFLPLNILQLELCSQCFIAKVFTVRRQPRSGSEAHCIHESDNVFVRINFNGKSSIHEDGQVGG